MTLAWIRERSTAICWRAAPASAVLVIGLLTGACSRDTEDPPSAEQRTNLVAFDPFPADMSAWTCDAYLEALTGSTHQATLDALLELRPHEFWRPIGPDELFELDEELILESRRDEPIYRHLVHHEILDSLKDLIRTANDTGLSLRVQSAYRSPSYQNLLWKLSVRQYQSNLGRAAFAVAPPCFTEHSTGRAVDFATAGGVSRFAESAEYHWLRQHAAEWGWFQSFRQDTGAVSNPSESGFFVEPWHFHHVSMRTGRSDPIESH
jgi:LAS superfamily LD-carboxypeptidase LdcB